MKKKFFTADWHLSELKAPNTWSFHRDFETPEQMNDKIIANINKYVGEDDELYVLGDVGVGPQCEPWLAQIRCKNLFLIIGEKDEAEWAKEVLPKYFKSPWFNTTTVKIETLPNTILCLAHKPSVVQSVINTLEHGDNQYKWMSPKPLFFGLNGHIHRARAGNNLRNTLTVSCDLWDYVPLSQERIAHLYGAITKFWDNEVFEQ